MSLWEQLSRLEIEDLDVEDGEIALEAIVLVKSQHPERQNPFVYARYTDSLSGMEAIGMLRYAEAQLIRRQMDDTEDSP